MTFVTDLLNGECECFGTKELNEYSNKATELMKWMDESKALSFPNRKQRATRVTISRCIWSSKTWRNICFVVGTLWATDMVCCFCCCSRIQKTEKCEKDQREASTRNGEQRKKLQKIKKTSCRRSRHHLSNDISNFRDEISRFSEQVINLDEIS